MNFTRSCQFYEGLRFLRRVATLLKSGEIYEVLQLLSNIVTLMRDCDFSKVLGPFRQGTIKIYSRSPLLSINYVDFLSF